MNAIVKPYFFRASVISVVIILLGLSLSFLVYFASEKVRSNAVTLVEKNIPTLTSINQVIADLNEQERIVYEYYSSQDSQTFMNEYLHLKTMIDSHQEVIVNQEVFKVSYQAVLTGQGNIERIINEFHNAMGLQVNNWDYLRKLLNDMSNERRLILPILLEIENQTKMVVDQAHSDTMLQMLKTHYIVISFSFSIILLGLLVAWYSKRYVLTTAKNNRLALFSQRNPNPIISVNQSGEVTFFNQASKKLLEDVGLLEDNISCLTPQHFFKLREQMLQENVTSKVLEQTLKDRVLQININWLTDIDAYDLHLVDITDKRLAEQRISDLAYLNQETKLPNKYQMHCDIHDLTSNETPFTHGILAIKHFNRIVSTNGVQCTQSLVIEFAKVLRQSIPSNIKLYQVNESQFALICIKSIGNAHQRVESLVEDINQIIEKNITTHQGEFFIELDIGFSFYPEHSDTGTGVLKNTRTALTFAEQDEYNQWLIFDSLWADKLSESATLLDNLRLALARKELFLVFQPQLDLAKNKIIGIETLVRWRHENKIISPLDFISLAEKSGLIVPIGEWILEEASRFGKQLIEQGHSDIVVAVNVSPRQFSHPNFCQSVIDVLAKVKLPAQHLELEITEGVFMHNEQEMLNVLKCLKGIGVQLSIDDFGTGYSSLSYLKQFPVDKLKIDQSFIRECHVNEEDRALVSTIVALGKNLGLSLIAEGVEEVEHVDFLNALNCDEIQGYWFSRPLEKQALIEFVEKHENSIEAIKNKAIKKAQ